MQLSADSNFSCSSGLNFDDDITTGFESASAKDLMSFTPLNSKLFSEYIIQFNFSATFIKTYAAHPKFPPANETIASEHAKILKL